jgi:hypothetical protein
MSTELCRWTLSNGGTHLSCISRPLSSGSELIVIYCDGLPLRNQICSDETEAGRWANEHRAAWEAVGWRSDSAA